jgi:hypothetical protein
VCIDHKEALLCELLFLVHVQLAEWIKTGSTESGNVSKALCEDISKHCRSTRYAVSDVPSIFRKLRSVVL